MAHFSIGLLSLVFAGLFVLAYLLRRGVQHAHAYLENEPGPKDRRNAKIALFAVGGFILGSFAQPLWDRGVECKNAGQPVAACVLLPQR